jgi:fibro-slime domain-containing protein
MLLPTVVLHKDRTQLSEASCGLEAAPQPQAQLPLHVHCQSPRGSEVIARWSQLYRGLPTLWYSFDMKANSRTFMTGSILVFCAAATFAACGTESDPSLFPDGGSSGSSGSSGESSGFIPFPDASGRDGASGDGSCTPQLIGLARDFRGADEPMGHADFESVVGARTGLDPNMVQVDLGADKKPVFSGPSKSQTTKANFDQWFRDTPGVNLTEEVTLPFIIDAAGKTVFDTTAFYPLDSKGFGNTPGRAHNYGFTYELHTEFLYQGGEVFNFRGDDDVWVFVNGKRIIDLGGVHVAESASITIDAVATAIGITKGQSYPLDFFFAERHTVESNFRFETTLKFVNCAPILPR